jgi:hypothetical protein
MNHHLGNKKIQKEKKKKKKKNFQYLKFNEGLSGGIVCALCNNQSTHQPEPIQYALNPRL